MTEPACPTPAKLRYATPAAAQKAADDQSALRGKPLRAYPCECGWWHLTTEPRDRRLRVSPRGVVYKRESRAPRPSRTEEDR